MSGWNDDKKRHGLASHSIKTNHGFTENEPGKRSLGSGFGNRVPKNFVQRSPGKIKTKMTRDWEDKYRITRKFTKNGNDFTSWVLEFWDVSPPTISIKWIKSEDIDSAQIDYDNFKLLPREKIIARLEEWGYIPGDYFYDIMKKDFENVEKKYGKEKALEFVFPEDLKLEPFIYRFRSDYIAPEEEIKLVPTGTRHMTNEDAAIEEAKSLQKRGFNVLVQFRDGKEWDNKLKRYVQVRKDIWSVRPYRREAKPSWYDKYHKEPIIKEKLKEIPSLQETLKSWGAEKQLQRYKEAIAVHGMTKESFIRDFQDSRRYIKRGQKPIAYDPNKEPTEQIDEELLGKVYDQAKKESEAWFKDRKPPKTMEELNEMLINREYVSEREVRAVHEAEKKIKAKKHAEESKKREIESKQIAKRLHDAAYKKILTSDYHELLDYTNNLWNTGKDEEYQAIMKILTGQRLSRHHTAFSQEHKKVLREALGKGEKIRDKVMISYNMISKSSLTKTEMKAEIKKGKHFTIDELEKYGILSIETKQKSVPLKRKKFAKQRDDKLDALPPGKRIVHHEDGSITEYYEDRKNRSDIGETDYPDE